MSLFETGQKIAIPRTHVCRRGRSWMKWKRFTVTNVRENTLTVVEPEKVIDVKASVKVIGVDPANGPDRTEIRTLKVAPPGFVIVDLDYSELEARMMTREMNDRLWGLAILKNPTIHFLGGF